VERIGEDSPVSRGDTVRVRVSVVNDGDRTRDLAIAQVGGCAAGEFFNVGEDQFVKDGDTDRISDLHQSGGNFGPLYGSCTLQDFDLLRDISGGGAPLLGIVEDSTPSDNWANVSFPAARLRTLTVTLDSVIVHDDMDNFSPGDWNVSFEARNFASDQAPRYGRIVFGPSFPNEEHARNVSTGETVSIGRSASVASISETRRSHC
jgi:hypothetical protein